MANTSEFIGVHKPTRENPHYFTYPTAEECSLIAEGKASAEFGCPLRAQRGSRYQSCSHGYESEICEYGVKK